MHSPSHPDLTVPIEEVARIVEIMGLHEFSDMCRWRVYNVLHEQGNVYITSQLTAVKDIIETEGRRTVVYFIPIRAEEGIVVHTYEEPLIPGHNDDPASLNPIANASVRARIEQVRSAYHTTFRAACSQAASLPDEDKKKAIEELTLEFYRVSGIGIVNNEPLRVSAEELSVLLPPK